MMTNFTGDENHQTFEELHCSGELTAGIEHQLIFLSALNIVLSLTAFFGNVLILVALHKESSLHSSSKVLYRNLAITDLCVGLIVEPLHVVWSLSVVTERWDTCRHAFQGAFTMAYILCAVSLFTLTAISVDRLLALLLGLRYKHFVTLQRTYLTVLAFWVISIACALMQFWNYLITLWGGYIGISVCLVTSTVSYAKIFFTLRYHFNNQDQPSGTISLNIARYKKAVSGALWVQLMLVLCYLPQGVVDALVTQRGLSSSVYIARSLTVTLLYLNSSLNPILYCWKIRGVRHAVKDTLKQLFCLS